MDVAIGIILVAFAGLVGIGYVAGMTVSASGQVSDASPPPPKTCAEFCMAWQMSRLDVCSAKSDLASAVAFFNACQQASNTAALAALAATAAATAAAWIPIFGAAIAGVLFIVASVLVAAAASAYSLMIGAGIAMAIRASALNDAETAEMGARAKVMSACSGTELANCLAMPAPC